MAKRGRPRKVVVQEAKVGKSFEVIFDDRALPTIVFRGVEKPSDVWLNKIDTLENKLWAAWNYARKVRNHAIEDGKTPPEEVVWDGNETEHIRNF